MLSTCDFNRNDAIGLLIAAQSTPPTASPPGVRSFSYTHSPTYTVTIHASIDWTFTNEAKKRQPPLFTSPASTAIQLSTLLHYMRRLRTAFATEFAGTIPFAPAAFVPRMFPWSLRSNRPRYHESIAATATLPRTSEPRKSLCSRKKPRRRKTRRKLF